MAAIVVSSPAFHHLRRRPFATRRQGIAKKTPSLGKVIHENVVISAGISPIAKIKKSL